MALKAFRETKASHRQLEWHQDSPSGRGKLRDNGEKPKALRRDDVQPKVIYLAEVSAGWKETIMSLWACEVDQEIKQNRRPLPETFMGRVCVLLSGE